MRKLTLIDLSIVSSIMTPQEVMTPELLLQLGRVSAIGITEDGQNLIYRVSTPDVAENKMNSKVYSISLDSTNLTEIQDIKDLVADKNISPDGKYVLYHEA